MSDVKHTAARNYGFSCWCGDCRNSLDCGDVSADEAENIAGSKGWVIGHFDGQGQIACPDCCDTVWDGCLLGTEEGRAKASGETP